MGTHLYDPIQLFEYTQWPIPIWVLRALVSQPLVILDQAGRLRSLYAMGGTCRPLATNKQTCAALSQFYDWLIRRNVRVIDCWLLLSLPAGGGSAAWWWSRPVLRGLCVTGRLVSGYSLSPPSPPTLSRIMDHKTARTRACASGGWRNAWTPFDHRM